MGSQTSLDIGMKEMIDEEFQKVQDQNTNKDYINLKQLLKLQIPSDDYTFTFSHLGNIFVLDQKREGKFYKQDLYNFAEFCYKEMKNVQTYEFQSSLQANTILKLWEFISKPKGFDEIIEWISRLIINTEHVRQFKEYQNEIFVSLDAVVIIYDIFNVKMMNELEIQGFFDMLYQCGIEQGIDINLNEELEDYVTLSTIKQFTKQFFNGFSNLISEIGFDQPPDSKSNSTR